MSIITLKPSTDLHISAQMTLSNMKEYYQQYGIEWQVDNVVQQIRSLENFDILSNSEIIGALRLDFENEQCLLRDLQIITPYKNKGYGSEVIERAKQIAINKGCKTVVLKVFKISPAQQLYLRQGFDKTHDDERFIHMECKL